MNYNLEIQKINLKIKQTTSIQEKISYIKQAILIADANNDIQWGVDLRFKLIDLEGYLAKTNNSIEAFVWILDNFDAYQAYFEVTKLLKNYHSTICTVLFNLRVTKDQITKLLEDYKQRLISAGYSIRSYYGAEVYWSLFRGDIQGARNYMELLETEPKDELSTEEEYLNIYLEFMEGNTETALARAKKCIATSPDNSYHLYVKLVYFLTLANDERAKEYFDHPDQLLSGSINYSHTLFSISDLMTFLSKHDKEKAWNYFEKYVDWIIDADEFYCFKFSLSVVPLFVQNEDRQLNLSSALPFYQESGIYNSKALNEYFSKLTYELGAKFDERNQSTYYQSLIKKYLN